MVIHSGWCFVARASTAREIESFTLRSERQNFLAQGERFEQVVCGLFGGALGAVGAFEHPTQLALAELPQCAPHAQVNVEGAAVRAKWICRFVSCRHGESLPGHARAVEWGSLELLQQAPADPAHHGDGLAVADRLVAGAVWAFTGRLAAPGDQRVVVGHTLEAFALDGSKAAHR